MAATWVVLGSFGRGGGCRVEALPSEGWGTENSEAIQIGALGLGLGLGLISSFGSRSKISTIVQATASGTWTNVVMGIYSPFLRAGLEK